MAKTNKTTQDASETSDAMAENTDKTNET